MKPCAKKPCSACPFARKSWPGYLGADTAEHFIASALADVEMPCHLTVDYERKDWRERMQLDAQQCAGLAVFFANTGKLSRDRNRVRLPADRETVFSLPIEFLEHHRDNAPVVLNPVTGDFVANDGAAKKVKAVLAKRKKAR